MKSLGDKIKTNYEDCTRFYLPRRTYTVIRLDGRGFSNYTRKLVKPFDMDLVADFDALTAFLCTHIDGCRLAYTQSDEITLILTDFEGTETQSWFNGNLQKIVSISASMATAEFNRLRWTRRCEDGSVLKPACFDSRVFTISDRTDAIRAVVWRQLDCIRNAIQMIAHSHMSHKEIQGLSLPSLKDELRKRNIIINDFPAGVRLGRICYRESYEVEIPNEFVKDDEESVVRHRWKIEDAPYLAANMSFFQDKIPSFPIIAESLNET